jgi:catechol 2,3-dioxygenase-like lactoylglutathione lyase family enzyme
MRHPAPAVRSVYETVLYAIDVLAAAEFYRTVLGMQLLANPDHNSAALRLPDGDAVLLLFNPAYAAT